MPKTPHEFIQTSFSPIVATLTSPKVDNIVSKNNLTFPELLQAFAIYNSEGVFREPGGSACIVKNWKLVIRDVNWKPLQPTEARRQLNNAALFNYDDKTVPKIIDGHKFDVSQDTPWFEAWRETYFQVQFPSDHEFTKHFLSCIIVATTLDENIIDTYNSLNEQCAQLQNVSPPKLPKWFNNSVLKSYLLLHDGSLVSKEKADSAFETIKQTFGASNCFMLVINSRQPTDPKLSVDYWQSSLKKPMESSNISNNLSLSNSNLLYAHQETSSIASTENVVTPEERPVPSQDGAHPLTSNESDMYDNANSLQTHSFSGSSESMSVIGIGKPLESSEGHGAALNSDDIEAIIKFIQEYASKALLPYIEKQIAQLTEVVANKKGVSRSLLSATKRWFTTGKSGTSTVNNTVIYSSDCPELQLRRLGDLYFLCGQWQRAFDAYHSAKREFYADSAWLCYAGALEMAAVSAFMAGEASRKTHAYMEESIVTYLNTCRMAQYAVRATLLSVPCLISSGLHGEAAKQLIRMTSEDSDLRSAMLLEQAALCFLHGPSNKTMSRKYAFHMVLAGHRFSKAGQKKHAHRCYKQAYQVYEESGWRLSTDHVQFALGRLAGALSKSREAARWLAGPLAPHSHQPETQQDAFLREFMLAHQQWVASAEEFSQRLAPLPVPQLLAEETAVLCAGPSPLSSPGRAPASSISFSDVAQHPTESLHWSKLEEALLQVVQGSVPMIFRPTSDLYTHSNDSSPIVPQGEPIHVAITLRNPLKVPLLLKDMELLWSFIESPSESVEKNVQSNECSIAAGQVLDSCLIHGPRIQSLSLVGESQQVVVLTVTPLAVGLLHVQGLAYKLISANDRRQNENSVTVSGKLALGGADKRLHITVIQPAPCLQMTFTETSNEVISGEMVRLGVEFRNAGPAPMRNLHVAVSHPECMHVLSSKAEDPFAHLYEEKYKDPPDCNDERSARAQVRVRAAQRRVRCVTSELAGACTATLWLRPRSCASTLCLLAYYETGLPQRPYRLLRHIFRFTTTDVVEILVTPRRCLGTGDDGRVAEHCRLAVEVKNICNEKEDDISLDVLEASLLSRQWRVTELVTAPGVNNSLVARERLHLIFKAVRMLDDLPEGKVEHSSLRVAGDSLDTVTERPFSKFVLDRVPSLLDHLDVSSQHEGRSGLIRSMLVLRWRAAHKSGATTIGQHCVWLDCFNKTISRRREKSEQGPVDEFESRVDLAIDTKANVEKSNVVILRLEHSNYVDHNFKRKRLCVIPIAVNIVNCYAVSVTVFVDMLKSEDSESTGTLGWTGALNNGLLPDSKELGLKVKLQKFESRKLEVNALCATPGTYSVGAAFSVTTEIEPQQVATSHLINNTSLLVVTQAD